MSNELVRIGNVDILSKEYKDQRVVTFKDIDAVHGRPEGTARKRFNDNKEHFIEKEDYFNLTAKDSLMSEKRTLEIPNRGLTVFTESGYLMLVKSFTDDLAWEVQRELVNSYFKAKEVVINRSELSPQTQALIALTESIAKTELEQKRQAEKIEQQGKQLEKLEEKQDAIVKTFQKTNDVENFQKWANDRIAQIAESPKFDRGQGKEKNYLFARCESYERLKQKRNCRLDDRVQNAVGRALKEKPDIKKSDLQKINKIYVIANDKDLRPAYELVIKEMMIAYCVKGGFGR